MSFSPGLAAFARTSSRGAAPTPSRRIALWWRKWKSTAIPALVLFAILPIWQFGNMLMHVPRYILPTPLEIVAALWEVRDAVALHTAATFGTVLAGFLLSIVTALPLAAALTLSPVFRMAFYPILVLTQSVPKVALAPILVLVLGTNIWPKIVITFLVAFFPLVISTAAGLAATPRELVELGRSLQATPIKELLRIRFPYAIPFVFSGLKMAITLSVIGAVVGEFVAADRGLGYLMTSSLAFFNTPLGYGAVVVLSVLAIVLFQIVVSLERLLFPWSARMRE